MAIRARRRHAVLELEDMTDRELAGVTFHGNLIENGTPVFRATLEQRREAGRLLAERGVVIPKAARTPPDPRPVLSGRPEDLRAVAAAQRRHRAARAAFLDTLG